MFGRIKRFLLGVPLPSHREKHERLSIPSGLAVFASDALSSTAYATEEILLALVLAGGVYSLQANLLSLPVAITIGLLMAIVVISYLQVIIIVVTLLLMTVLTLIIIPVIYFLWRSRGVEASPKEAKPVRKLLMASIVMGTLVLGGGGWWLWHSLSGPSKPAAVVTTQTGATWWISWAPTTGSRPGRWRRV